MVAVDFVSVPMPAIASLQLQVPSANGVPSLSPAHRAGDRGENQRGLKGHDNLVAFAV
jgi:hypothetical protein